MRRPGYITRRRFLASAASLSVAVTLFPQVTYGATEAAKRFVFVILRGAMDGMGALPPVGDPAFGNLRGRDTDYDGYIKLDGQFALHPSLKTMGRLYNQKQAIMLPAIAAPYRTRSHFDAQDLLEFGTAAKDGTRSGWLARLTDQMDGTGEAAIALSNTLPISLLGTKRALAWAPDRLPDASEDLLDRLADLYASNPAMETALAKARKSDDIANSMDDPKMGDGGNRGGNNQRNLFPQLAAAAGKFLKSETGLRLAVMEFGGWDTHSNQAARLRQQLAALDNGISALQTSLGEAWQDTCVLILSEFGRTANFNGSKGTDHGTAGTGFILGGAVKGGRIAGDWPGLKTKQLYEERDLFPANDAYAVIAGLMHDHLGIGKSVIQASILPGLRSKPETNLVL